MVRVDRIGVHLTHCCKRCGCKYGDPDCPVELGTLEPEFDCWDCEQRIEALHNEFLGMDLSELEKTVLLIQGLIQEKQTEVGGKPSA